MNSKKVIFIIFNICPYIFFFPLIFKGLRLGYKINSVLKCRRIRPIKSIEKISISIKIIKYCSFICNANRSALLVRNMTCFVGDATKWIRPKSVASVYVHFTLNVCRKQTSINVRHQVFGFVLFVAVLNNTTSKYGLCTARY